MARAEARAAAMQLVYAYMLGGEGGDRTLPDLLGFSPSGDDLSYIKSIVRGVLENAASLDALIEGHLVNWSLERLARVDLAILRVAAFEIMYRIDVPDAVAIDEALELSHMFSTEEASRFINGVLGNLLRAKAIQT